MQKVFPFFFFKGILNVKKKYFKNEKYLKWKIIFLMENFISSREKYLK